MKKLYPFLAGMALVSLGGLASSTVAQVKLSDQTSNRSVHPTQSILQVQASTTESKPQPACPLSSDIAVTFLGSKCQAVVLEAPRTYYRYYSTDSNKYGRYLTTDRYERNVDAIRKLALNQAWGNQATMMMTVTVPTGTTVYEGIVAAQDPPSCYVGGGQQTFIENTRDPNLVWSAGTPMQVEAFQCP
jgi:hypothetical protein